MDKDELTARREKSIKIPNPTGWIGDIKVVNKTLYKSYILYIDGSSENKERGWRCMDSQGKLFDRKFKKIKQIKRYIDSITSDIDASTDIDASDEEAKITSCIKSYIFREFKVIHIGKKQWRAESILTDKIVTSSNRLELEEQIRKANAPYMYRGFKIIYGKFNRWTAINYLTTKVVTARSGVEIEDVVKVLTRRRRIPYKKE